MLSLLDALNEKVDSSLGLRFSIQRTWIDMGANWSENTIIVTKPDGSRYQALSPRDLDDIENGDWQLVANRVIEDIEKRGW